ncbi:MAG: ABC transporter permease subunit [Phycisphaerales bacterium]|nr:ABC transporter permease subunit [Phycisphaerales bacterium]
MQRLGIAILLGGGALLAAAALLWPAGQSIADAFRGDIETRPLSGRQLGLLLRGVRVAVESAMVSQLIAIGIAAGLSRNAGLIRSITGWFCLCTVLTPTYIHAYSWSLLVLPAGVATSRALAGPMHEWLLTEGRAVWCLATWMSPIAAAMLAVGWREAGRAVFGVAQLDAATPSAARVASHALRPWLMISLIICFAIALTEFAVCHLSLCLTWNTEILSLMQDQASPGGVLRLAWPLIGVVVICGAALWPFRGMIRRGFTGEHRELGSNLTIGAGRWPRIAAATWIISLSILAAPTTIMALSLQSLTGFSQLGAIYTDHVRWSAITATASVAISIWIALAFEFLRLRRITRRESTRARDAVATDGARRSPISIVASLPEIIVLVAAILLAITPPALVGDAFASAYARIPLIRDHWIIVSMVGAARFGVVMLLALRIAAPRELGELARTDGASAWQELWCVRLPAARRTVAAAAMVVFVLAFNEIATTLLIVPPNVGSLPKTLLNAIHFGRNDAVIAMCLSVVALVGATAFVLMATPRSAKKSVRLSI